MLSNSPRVVPFSEIDKASPRSPEHSLLKKALAFWQGLRLKHVTSRFSFSVVRLSFTQYLGCNVCNLSTDVAKVYRQGQHFLKSTTSLSVY